MFMQKIINIEMIRNTRVVLVNFASRACLCVAQCATQLQWVSSRRVCDETMHRQRAVAHEGANNDQQI